MIPVADATARILARIAVPTPVVELPLALALAHALAGDVEAPFDVPPDDNSAVDGFAVRGADLRLGATARLRVVGDLPAGAVHAGAIGPGETLRIMTGAPMPAGADTVVPRELASSPSDPTPAPAGASAKALAADGDVSLAAVPIGANVRARGEDVRAGAIVLRRGALLGPAELGLLASLGHPKAQVHRRPRVALLSTGDEVVEPGAPRRPGQIYDANRFSLGGLVRNAGAEPLDLGIVPDLRSELKLRLEDAARRADIVISSGGVSVGDYDHVRAVLAEIGGIEFWQVAMQPGRPLAVGAIGEVPFFGLPGNPVASVLCFLLFVRPALWKLGGRRELTPMSFTATATEPMSKRQGRREFKRGIFRFTERGFEVATTGPQGSGILSSLVAANCLIVLEEPRGNVSPGETVLVEPL